MAQKTLKTCENVLEITPMPPLDSRGLAMNGRAFFAHTKNFRCGPAVTSPIYMAEVRGSKPRYRYIAAK